jgi:homoserine dehydrogenase
VLRDGVVADRTSASAASSTHRNYILSKMSAEGAQFDDVLREAQARGLAEADPSFDIDGIDSAHKLVILTALAFGTELHLKDVYTEGIRHVAQMDVGYARELGYEIKLLAIGSLHGDDVAVRVHPTLVPATHVLAGVRGRSTRSTSRARRSAPACTTGSAPA